MASSSSFNNNSNTTIMGSSSFSPPKQEKENMMIMMMKPQSQEDHEDVVVDYKSVDAFLNPDSYLLSESVSPISFSPFIIRKRSTITLASYEGEQSPSSSNKVQKLDFSSGTYLQEPLPVTPVSQTVVAENPYRFPIVPLAGVKNCKQFWKAGDYDILPMDTGSSSSSTSAMDHARVHPRFLHSNATSHKWALGAFAELLDNSLDEVYHGATFANIDVLENKKDGSKMLLVEDNGGGMDPRVIRNCMSLGYSVKSKMANTIGQYGNGFKTSSMRLGADVIVFSRSPGKNGQWPTQSIGMLSYTFLRKTGKEDIVVPIVDYEQMGGNWNRIIRSSCIAWERNLETIVQWSPYLSEEDLLKQFNLIKNQGTRVVIYNLWEDDLGDQELDFDIDQYDIQIRGLNRDEKKIEMANNFPNSRHFLTYKHSLRSYASILYLRLPLGFRIILRGKDVEHHSIVEDMMMKEETTYRPQLGDSNCVAKDANLVAVITLGFVKDAKEHIDVQGFNVYHKNRLIKPFWRVWTAAGSDGRGVIGVLEANFVEPAHDKQGFEKTSVLSRLEQKLVSTQKKYWSTKCHEIGYAARTKQTGKGTCNTPDSGQGGSQASTILRSANKPSTLQELASPTAGVPSTADLIYPNEVVAPVICVPSRGQNADAAAPLNLLNAIPLNAASLSIGNADPLGNLESSLIAKNQKLKRRLTETEETLDLSIQQEREKNKILEDKINGPSPTKDELKEENRQLNKRLKQMEEKFIDDLQAERDRRAFLEVQLKENTQNLEKLDKETEAIIEVFAEERTRRDEEEAKLRTELKEASKTIEELLVKMRCR